MMFATKSQSEKPLLFLTSNQGITSVNPYMQTPCLTLGGATYWHWSNKMLNLKHVCNHISIKNIDNK